MEDNRPIIGNVIDNDGVIIRPIRESDRFISGNSTKALQIKKMREIEAKKSGDKQEWNLEHFFKGHIPEIRECMRGLFYFL